MKRLIWVLWPSFVVAGIAEALFFTLIDPQELYLFGEPVELFANDRVLARLLRLLGRLRRVQPVYLFHPARCQRSECLQGGCHLQASCRPQLLSPGAVLSRGLAAAAASLASFEALKRLWRVRHRSVAARD